MLLETYAVFVTFFATVPLNLPQRIYFAPTETKLSIPGTGAYRNRLPVNWRPGWKIRRLIDLHVV